MTPERERQMVDWERAAEVIGRAHALASEADMAVAQAEYYARPRVLPVMLMSRAEIPVEPYTLDEIEARLAELRKTGWPG